MGLLRGERYANGNLEMQKRGVEMLRKTERCQKKGDDERRKKKGMGRGEKRKKTKRKRWEKGKRKEENRKRGKIDKGGMKRKEKERK